MRGSSRNFSHILAAVSILALAGLSPLHAATLAAVEFPDQAVVGGKPLVLNGLGLRTATMLKVEVYVIGLYLEAKSSDAGAIIESPQTKRLAMHFVRNVTADKLRDGWKEGFDANYKDVDSIKAEIEKFNASMRDVKKGDRIVLDFRGNTRCWLTVLAWTRCTEVIFRKHCCRSGSGMSHRMTI